MAVQKTFRILITNAQFIILHTPPFICVQNMKKLQRIKEGVLYDLSQKIY